MSLGKEVLENEYLENAGRMHWLREIFFTSIIKKIEHKRYNYL